MRVLLSIKPVYVEKIFSGEKVYEFRRTIFKNPDVKRVIVYASSPVQKVVGEFEIDHVIHDDLKALWRRTKRHAGISEEHFHQYFDGKEKGFAIKIKSKRRYRSPKCIRRDFNLLPPQSFLYL